MKIVDVFARINFTFCSIYIPQSFISKAIIVSSKDVVNGYFKHQNKSFFCFDLDKLIENLTPAFFFTSKDKSNFFSKTVLICNINEASLFTQFKTNNFAIISKYKPSIVTNSTNTFKSFHGTPAKILLKHGINSCFFEKNHPCFKFNIQQALQASYSEASQNDTYTSC